MDRLPIHGFVLAGGRSSRMGRDKALVVFRGLPMVGVAVEKLRSFCAAVSIVGEREDLENFAPVVPGERADAGAAAGIEAGLRACGQDWAMFIPVDVPLVPETLLGEWVARAMTAGGGYLVCAGKPHAAIALLRREALAAWTAGLDDGERKLTRLMECVGAAEVEFAADQERWLLNVNTPQELAEAASKRD